MVVVHLQWVLQRCGQELFCPQSLYLLQIVVLFRSQSSDLLDECLHHICLSLSRSFSLSPLLSCHAHDSRCTTQRQLRYHVEWRFPTSITCAVNASQCRVSVKRTWMT